MKKYISDLGIQDLTISFVNPEEEEKDKEKVHPLSIFCFNRKLSQVKSSLIIPLL